MVINAAGMGWERGEAMGDGMRRKVQVRDGDKKLPCVTPLYYVDPLNNFSSIRHSKPSASS